MSANLLAHYLNNLYYGWVVPYRWPLCAALALVALWRLAALALAVWQKRRLIRAAVQQTADEVSRLEYITIEQEIDRMGDLMSRFVIEGLATARESTPGLLLGTLPDDAPTLAGAADKVHQFTWEHYRTFVKRRYLLRHVLDGLDAMVGRRRSTETAWAKGLIYLEKYYVYAAVEGADMPWVQPFLKAVGLPHNIWASTLADETRRASARLLPRGWFSLWIACALFDYVGDMHYGIMIRKSDKTTEWVERRGRSAWELLLTFKAWHYQRVELAEKTS